MSDNKLDTEAQYHEQEKKTQSQQEQVKSQKDFQQEQHKSEIEHLSEPFWFSRQLVEKPCHIMCGCLSIILICIAFAGGFFKFNQSSGRDFLVFSDTKIKNFDAYAESLEAYNDYYQKQSVLAERTVEQDFQQTFLVYTAKKGTSVLTPENLKTIQKVEKHITTLKNKQYEKLCLAKSSQDPSCQNPGSIAFMIKNGYEGEITQSDIDNFLNGIKNSEDQFQGMKVFFDKKFTQTQTKAEIVRSIFNFAYPHKGFNSTKDEDDKQFENFKEWNDEVYDYIYEGQSTDTLDVSFFNTQAIVSYGNRQLSKDIQFTIFALIFVTIYMIIHTKSFATGNMGMLIMVLTFPLSFFIYRLILQFTYFASIHTSILFLLMGIGADDVFVFFDAWQQAGQMAQIKDDLLKRTSYCYRRASKAMLITSMTTVFAFLATAISVIMPIMTYGIFAAINILVNFILVITLFPAFLVLREKFLQSRLKRQSSAKVNSQEQSKVDDNDNDNQQNKEQQPAENVPQQQQQQVESQNDDPDNELSTLQKIFKNYWTVWTYKLRYVIVILFIGLMAFNIYGTSQLSSPKESPTMLQDDHFMKKALNKGRNDFHSSSDAGNQIIVNFVWGIEGLDRDGVDYFDPEDMGKPIPDNSFDLSIEANQLRMLQICQEIKNDKYNLISQGDDSIKCFMNDFQAYLQTISRQIPVPQSEFLQILQQFLDSPQGYSIKSLKLVGLYENKLHYTVVRITGNTLNRQGRKVYNPVHDKFKKWIEEINKNSEKGLNKAYQTSGSWMWTVSEEALLYGAIQGILISISLAFIVLLISTMNIIMSFFSIISIAGVVLGVLMSIWAKGWDFGTFESMNSIIIIGLSVDYIVHLVNSYVESEQKDRYKRTQDMLTIMGVSVFGGGMTTLGAGLFLFGGKVRFFQVMGTLVSATIGFSILWALFFFPALCHIIGTQNQVGSLQPCVDKIFNKKKQQANQ